MEKFCDFITNPDWCSVILSAISTIAVIAIAVVQIRIQRQQTRVQEYDVYKAMFSVVEDANDIAKQLLNNIYCYFASSNTRAINENALVCLLDNIKEVERKLKDSRADFKLKFLHSNYHAECYIAFMKEMWGIIQLFIKLESAGYIKFIADDNDYEVEIYDEDQAKYDTTIINALLDRIQNDKYKASIKEALISYSNRKNRILKLDIAGKIKDNC